MSIILGFGCIEEQERNSVKQSLMDCVRSGRDVSEVIREWNSKADEYDKLPRQTAPERYTRIYYYDNTIHFHHIHRNHALSPDGWALLMVEEPIYLPR